MIFDSDVNARRRTYKDSWAWRWLAVPYILLSWAVALVLAAYCFLVGIGEVLS